VDRADRAVRTRLRAAQIADRGLRDVLFDTRVGGDRLAGLRARLDPLGRQIVARAQADGRLRADLDPTDLPALMVGVIAVGDLSADTQPEQWRRCLRITLDGLRSSRDGPTPLPVTALAEPHLDGFLRSFGSSARRPAPSSGGAPA